MNIIDTLPLSAISLEALHKETLYISESTLSGITRIGEGNNNATIINVYICHIIIISSYT